MQRWLASNPWAKICWNQSNSYRICATPLLHYSTLKLGCAAGCMITASHNPVSDSGVKIFDENGYKTFPQIEETLTQTAFGLQMKRVYRCDS